MTKTKIIVISTVHFPYDSRIVYRECESLAKKFDILLLIPDADASVSRNFRTKSLPFFSSIIWRLLVVHPLVLWQCCTRKSEVVHIHDPELLPIALLVHFFGKKVVYDVHENIRKQFPYKIRNKFWLFQQLFLWLDTLARKHFYIILSEQSYQETYHDIQKPYRIIYNYPSLDFFEGFRSDIVFEQRHEIFYIGQISKARCFGTLIEALFLLKQEGVFLKTHIFGGFEFDINRKEDLSMLPYFDEVINLLIFHGKTDPRIAFNFAKNAFVGIALLQPLADFVGSYPTKLFEYMAVGLPVITSDFELYSNIVDGNNCGFCQNPFDALALAQNIKFLLKNPVEARQFGQNGRNTVVQSYNWNSEEQKLFDFYTEIVG